MDEIVIVSAARTPFGKFGGSLASFSAPQLGGLAIKEALRRANLSGDQVDEAIMGIVVPAGVGQVPARQAAVAGGIPHNVPSFTLNKVCGSALKAVTLGTQIIKAGDADTIVAGGMESMSNAPYLVPGARWASGCSMASWWTPWSKTACGARITTFTWRSSAARWPWNPV